MRTFPSLLALCVLVAVAGCQRSPRDVVVGAERNAAPAADDAVPPATVPDAAQRVAGDAAARHFAAMDGDGDGAVTIDEHVEGAASMFATMDADADGTVTAAEMDAAQRTLGGDARLASADKIRVVDTNGDGALSATEHALGSRGMFEAMDADGDGRLTAGEMRAGHDRAMSAAGDG